uniref:DUF295 domain-containing protein n=1 Tax=Oryza meridionalis TaxID=40149 RepID=A0A0E0EUT4_9ORYZ
MKIATTLLDDDDLIRLIYSRLDCVADRVQMRQVCRTWRSALPPVQQQRCPPFLLVGGPGGPSFSCGTGGGGCSGNFHFMRVPEYARGARYFGTYPGGWLFLALKNRTEVSEYALVSLRTEQLIPVPDSFYFISDPASSRNVVITAATLSATPQDPEGCYGAAICSRYPFPVGDFVSALWLVGVSSTAIGTQTSVKLEDVIWFEGAFHFLTLTEKILVFRVPEFYRDNDGNAKRAPAERILHFDAGGRDYGNNKVLRYLVESRGKLLMVCRIIPVLPLMRMTTDFRVFEMEERPKQAINNELLEERYAWNELDSLDGRVADYPNIKLQDGVLFVDDGKLYCITGEGAIPLHHPCKDNQVWLAAKKRVPGGVVNFLPERAASNCSPPTWFLP